MGGRLTTLERQLQQMVRGGQYAKHTLRGRLGIQFRPPDATSDQYRLIICRDRAVPSDTEVTVIGNALRRALGQTATAGGRFTSGRWHCYRWSWSLATEAVQALLVGAQDE